MAILQLKVGAAIIPFLEFCINPLQKYCSHAHTFLYAVCRHVAYVLHIYQPRPAYMQDMCCMLKFDHTKQHYVQSACVQHINQANLTCMLHICNM